MVSRCGPNVDDEELKFALALSRHLEEEDTRKQRHEEEDSNCTSYLWRRITEFLNFKLARNITSFVVLYYAMCEVSV